MRRQALFTLGSLALCAAAAGAQERRDDRGTRIYRAPLEAARAISIERGPRAAIGVSTQPSGGLRDTLGLLVSSITPGGPAEKAGIEEGNRLQAINAVSLRAPKEDVEDWGSYGFLQRRLTRELDKLKPGDEVTLRVYGGGRTRDVRVKTMDSDSLFRSRFSVVAGSGRRLEEVRVRADSLRKLAEDRPTLGISLGSTGSPRDTLGVLVMGVTSGGPAEKAGLEEGARIQAIDGVDLRVPREDAEDGWLSSTRARRLTRAVQEKKAGDEVELRVYQAGQTRTVRVKTVRAGDLPGRRSTFIIGDGFNGVMDVMPGRVPMAPMPPMGRGGVFRYDFDDDLSFRGLDDLRIEIDGARLGRELQRIGPELRDRLRDIGPEIRYNIERAMREAERGLDGVSIGLDAAGRALEGLDVRVDVDVDRAPRLREKRSESPAKVPATKVVTSF